MSRSYKEALLSCECIEASTCTLSKQMPSPLDDHVGTNVFVRMSLSWWSNSSVFFFQQNSISFFNWVKVNTDNKMGRENGGEVTVWCVIPHPQLQLQLLTERVITTVRQRMAATNQWTLTRLNGLKLTINRSTHHNPNYYSREYFS
jgi:hypothetical protein